MVRLVLAAVVSLVIPPVMPSAGRHGAVAGQGWSVDTRAPALVTAFRLRQVSNAVTTTPDGRTFIGFPRLQGEGGMSVAEAGAGNRLHPYPDAAWNAWKPGEDARRAFVRVNALRIGPDGHLWVVDTGVPGFGESLVPGGSKVVVIDVRTDKVRRVYPLDRVGHPKSHIGDLRIHRGHAYLTDAGDPGALIVLDLGTGVPRRVLEGDLSTTARRPVMAEGKPMTGPDGKPVRVNATHLEVSPDGEYLYFQPLSGPLHRVRTRWLNDPALRGRELSGRVQPWVDTPSTGGTAIDAAGNIYLSDVDRLRILRISPDREVTTVIQDRRLLWPDALWIDGAGQLWIPIAQRNRLARFQGGRSHVVLPAHIYKLKIGARPAPIGHPARPAPDEHAAGPT
ncbi:SMP-30/gluconolactonase/LRE family protein [Nonomuraea jiangxiensis]|uniref:Sugar lactone lactonase YvrE n=1 Tax=Nonomuraea jiangxiensis TaxID=633440 RepID=A0A1G7ZQ54_9ACTN|nr:L-dopachrome tautomerase-related protein [Nonomuraea jiangxiensis]SDH10882.1 Sugar lactone lactonase YvrE [Nonomuraea jiangxiensis]